MVLSRFVSIYLFCFNIFDWVTIDAVRHAQGKLFAYTRWDCRERNIRTLEVLIKEQQMNYSIGKEYGTIKIAGLDYQ